MKRMWVLLASAGLWACSADSDDAAKGAGDAPDISPAALTFDGGDYATDADKLAHGGRMVKVLGCLGCHTDTMEGQNITEGDPAFGDIYAANASLKLPDYSDEELMRLLKEGVPKDGHEMTFMPSEMFQHASDADLAAVIAWLRANIQPKGEPQPPHKPGPALQAMKEAGEYTYVAEMASQWKDVLPLDAGPETAKGRYIAGAACTECHNNELQGFENFSPNLSLAAMYEPEEFVKLMREGVGKTKPDLGLMAVTARGRFANFTDDEIAALHAYLKARAENLPPE
ncbi:c-type cytochrome [Sphingomicrobium nitratireducens]|uniref:c-type cytochrome n=1 Tax=Sphingomicrobium nitratireducens TaxID=2964666 RepID=UPI00223EBAFE|nr:c-type cytochrome [Sphingomicrobium nitratireducens]